MNGFLRFFLLVAFAILAQADDFDNAIRAVMDDEFILGASVAFYDGVRTKVEMIDRIILQLVYPTH